MNLRASLTRLAREGLDVLAPLRCPLCGERLRARAGCETCLAGEGVVRQLRCDRLGPYLVLGGGPFRGALRRLVHAFKFGADAVALHMAAAQAAAALPADPVWDALVPTPAHRVRVRERGWEPVVELTRALGERTGLPMVRAVRRPRHTPRLTGRRRGERRRLVHGAFASAGARGHLLLVDDVTTTGATFRECRRVLLGAGASSVDLLVVAVTPVRGLGHCRPLEGVVACRGRGRWSRFSEKWVRDHVPRNRDQRGPERDAGGRPGGRDPRRVSGRARGGAPPGR